MEITNDEEMTVCRVFKELESNVDLKSPRKLRGEKERKKKKFMDSEEKKITKEVVPRKKRKKRSNMQKEEKIKLFRAKMWIGMKIARRNERFSKFQIDISNEKEAKLWSELFNMIWSDDYLKASLPLQHTLKRAIWRKNVTSGDDLKAFSNCWRCYTNQHTGCVSFNVGVEGKCVNPMKISLYWMVITSWKSKSVLGEEIIKDSVERESFFYLNCKYFTSIFKSDENEENILSEKCKIKIN
jgi:hypothetical protein